MAARSELVLHHCLGVSIQRSAEWLGISESVAAGCLAEAEAAVAPLIPSQ